MLIVISLLILLLGGVACLFAGIGGSENGPADVPVQGQPDSEGINGEDEPIDIEIPKEEEKPSDEGATTPGEGTTTPGEGTTTPGEGTTTPGEGTTTPGEGTTTPETPDDGDDEDDGIPDLQPYEEGIWVISGENEPTKFETLPAAYEAAVDGDIILISGSLAPTEGIVISGKNLTVCGQNAAIDTSALEGSLFTVGADTTVLIAELTLSGGAAGFEVDYDAVTFKNNFNVPLVADSSNDDVKRDTPVITSSGNLEMRRVIIRDHYSTGNGAALSITGGEALIWETDFIHNLSKGGGAVYMGADFTSETDFPIGNITFEDCSFKDNYAVSGGGGAIYMINTEAVRFDACEFSGNACNGSGGYGGAVMVGRARNRNPYTDAEKYDLDYTQITVSGCVFDGNWAGNDGFAIQNYDAELSITDTEFKNNVGVNSSSSVATISCQVTRYTRATDVFAVQTISGCSFIGNSGPVSCIGDHGGRSTFNVSDTEFRGNSGGSAVLFYTGVATFDNCDFFDDKSTKAIIFMTPNDVSEWYKGSGETAGRITVIDCSFDVDESVEQTYGNVYVCDGYNDVAKSTLELKGKTFGSIMLTDGHYLHLYGTHTGNITVDEATDPETNITIETDASLVGEIIVP